VTAPFGIGDHVAIGEYVGRVVDAGVLDVEIQSRDRELVSLPNSFVAASPVTRTRESGAIVSTSLSLGYDNHHEVIAPLLREAASQSGLEDPFVGIVALGDFAVTYRVAGLLRDLDKLIGAHTGLACAVLDTLHDNGIEIMSPNFVRKQSWPHEERIIPAPIRASQPAEEATRADEVVFDKASRAEQLALETSRLKAERVELGQRRVESQDEERLRIRVPTRSV
jgi:small conductance mechanosensitive channel